MKQEEKELWEYIKDYPEYKVSNLGRIKRLAYYKNVCNGGKQYCEERILKPQKRKFGYLAVMLCKKGIKKSFLIHRLVAMTFIPNPQNLPQVNHKDENPSNNKIDNLKWCNQKYNSNYGTSKKRISEKLKNGVLSKAVERYNKEGDYIDEFPSAIEASRILNLNVSGIVSCCNENKKYKTCGGFQWKYKGSEKEIKNLIIKILQFDKKNNYINTYNSLAEASKLAGISRTAISNCLSNLSNTAGGYIWRKN